MLTVAEFLVAVLIKHAPRTSLSILCANTHGIVVVTRIFVGRKGNRITNMVQQGTRLKA